MEPLSTVGPTTRRWVGPAASATISEYNASPIRAYPDYRLPAVPKGTEGLITAEIVWGCSDTGEFDKGYTATAMAA